MNTKFDVGEELECKIKAKICSISINEDGKVKYRIIFDGEIFGLLNDYVAAEEKLCKIVMTSKEW